MNVYTRALQVAYMAPELFSGGAQVDERCDVFSFGTILWELLSGRRPWGEYGNVLQVSGRACRVG